MSGNVIPLNLSADSVRATEILTTKNVVEGIARAALSLSVGEIERLHQELDRSDSVIPLTEETAWLYIHKRLVRFEALVNAVLQLRLAIEEATR